MITTRIQIESYLAEYVRGKYYDETIGTVRFPSSSDIYVTIYDLMEKRPVNCPADRGNLEFMLPDRREANFAGGKASGAAASLRNSSIIFPYVVPLFLKSVCVP